MPKCKYCHENITKFDREFCPFCGGHNPLEGNDCLTQDITQTIDVLKSEKTKSFKQHSKKVTGILCMFLGIFGADSFYLGFSKYGFLRILVNIIIWAVLSCGFYFIPPLINDTFKLELYLSFILSFLVLFVFYFIAGIISFFTKNKKDSNGVFVR